ncbi:hypothetical protein BGZ95_011003 [Linnemannia exigua]|uniref:RNI-like protein n=1 Tax=Linnemannia exigua TaxID=604196 RepID=A0AAD4H4L0_9FUNG|nr:hypothetical protein BGZ95_011003 [Linnemannia exigua]
MAFITTYLDPSARMEVMFWHDIRAMFMDAVYVRHNSRTLEFLKDANGNMLFPLRVAAIHRAVLEIVVDAPLKLPVSHVQNGVFIPPTPRPAPLAAARGRPPPVPPHIVPRPPVLPVIQQAPRPTARSIMGRIASHINLVLLQEKGEGNKKDFPIFLKCYLKAVHKGHAYAQFAVGKLYIDGKVVVQDCTKAMEWFIKAANLGDANAQNEIGVLYTQGHGVSQDYKKAMGWLTKAANQGHAIAQTNISILQDHNKALKIQQQQDLDRLAVIQGRIQAILTQTYGVHEDPIPRLFIILPKKISECNPASLLANQFQLYFLCECGEHTEELNDDNTNIPHHIHIAMHKGYDLQRPAEFFQKYGRYMLTLLEMIKYGSTITGFFVPALPSVEVSGAADILRKSQGTTIPSAINQSIKYLQSLSSKQHAAKDTSTDSFTGHGTLEGTDLQHLKMFIKNQDLDRALGDLYRTITEEGHAKWVCISHYRLAYKEQDQEAFVAAVKVSGGRYDPHLGRFTVSFGSKIQATRFFKVLAKTRRVDDLDVTFDWEGITGDLEAFGDTLERCSVSILRLDLRRFRTRLASIFQRTHTQQQMLARCINLPSMKMIHIILPMDLFELSSIQLERLSFRPKLSFEVVSGQGGFELGKSELEKLAEILKANSTLTTLNLTRNSIGDVGAVILSEALRTNSTLTTLDLYCNSIGGDGAVALSEALKTNSTLTTLNFYGNWIGANGAKALSETLKINSALITLNLSFNSIGNNGAKALSEALKTNSTLTTLNLRKNPIGENGAVALSEALMTNSSLTTLDLSHNLSGENGAAALSEALEVNSTLTTLDLSFNSIGDIGAVALSEALKTNSTLATLDLYNNWIGDNGAVALSEALKTNSTLTTLGLYGNCIGENGAVGLSKALKINSTLTTLDFYGNSIGEYGAAALSEALMTNSALTTLKLTGNSIKENGAAVLSEALKTNFTLITLDLSFNSIGDNGVRALSESLKINSTLTTLSLNNNWIGYNGAKALCEALRINSTLTTLHLFETSIGENGAVVLSEALKTNSVLTTLNLSNNSIEINGAVALAEALKANSTLTTLDLTYNAIGENGDVALSDALKINSTVRISR